MEAIPRVLGFVAQGASTNWWGLACPSHCFAAGPFVVLSAFALGITCGLFLAVFLAWTFLRPFSVDSAPQSSSSAAGIVCGPTCMSLSHHTSSHDEEDEVNLSTQFQGLFISVRGSASSSVDFVQRIAAVSDTSSLSASPIRPASSASLPRSLESVRETRSDIEASFPACPVSWLRAAGRLQATSTKFSGEQRIQRAWKAGNWA